jgi:histidine transport system substrate-binding protein
MFNQALAQVHQDGTFRKLEKQYFDFDTYPGH